MSQMARSPIPQDTEHRLSGILDEKFCPPGHRLIELIGDSMLSKYACVIVDEAHERIIDTDMTMALFKTNSFPYASISTGTIGPSWPITRFPRISFTIYSSLPPSNIGQPPPTQGSQGSTLTERRDVKNQRRMLLVEPRGGGAPPPRVAKRPHIRYIWRTYWVGK